MYGRNGENAVSWLPDEIGLHAMYIIPFYRCDFSLSKRKIIIDNKGKGEAVGYYKRTQCQQGQVVDLLDVAQANSVSWKNLVARSRRAKRGLRFERPTAPTVDRLALSQRHDGRGSHMY